MPRPVLLRVNGIRVTKARVRLGKHGAELVITEHLLGEFSIGDGCTFELLELLFPQKMRGSLSNGGWRKVSLRLLMGLIRCGAIMIRDSEEGTAER
jgi:hypothetical protein